MEELKDFINFIVVSKTLEGINISTEINDSDNHFKVCSKNKEMKSTSGITLITVDRRVNKTQTRFVFWFSNDEKYLYDRLDQIVKSIPKNQRKILSDEWSERAQIRQYYDFSVDLKTKNRAAQFIRSLTR